MANYNRIKSAKAVPIGTIMPWTGSSSSSAVAEDAIPFGYIVCRGQSLRALDYPLLAQLLGIHMVLFRNQEVLQLVFKIHIQTMMKKMYSCFLI